MFFGDGKQYVGVAAGGNSFWGFRQGAAVVSGWRTGGVPCAIGRASLPVVMDCKERGT